MRSQNFLRRSRGLFRSKNFLSLSSNSIPARPPKKPAAKRFLPHSQEKRLVSTDNNPQNGPVPSSESESPPDSPPEGPSKSGASPPPPSDDPEKSTGKRAARTSDHDIELPQGLSILWTPDQLPSQPLNPGSVPPPEILEDALHKLLVTLHPQTQHRAAYPTPLAPSVEPTLALYCPIEGGDYIIDSAVVELARRTGSEVLVLDAVQLAAGEWGYFGPAANSLKLPRNPLHFPSSSSPGASKSPSTSSFVEEDDDPDFSSQPMMFTVMTPSSRGSSSTTVMKPRRPVPPTKVKVFFDSLVNLPSKSGQNSRPRLIYIRDFPTLASTSSAWYPYLRDAVNQRRKGPMTRSSSPVQNPITIIFGMSPPLIPPPERPNHPSGSGILSLLMNRSASLPMHLPVNPRSDKGDWTESPAAEQAREKRLQQRLKSWEKGEDIVMDEHHKYSEDYSEGSRGGRGQGIIVVDGHSPVPSGMAPFPMPSHSSSTSDDTVGPSFYRTSVLVPSVRSVTDERDFRVLRRREINELTVRMAIGAIGGVLEDDGASSKLSFTERPSESGLPASPDTSVQREEVTAETHTSEEETPSSPDQDSTLSPRNNSKMWDVWGRQLEPWANMRQIADRAIGGVVASCDPTKRPTLEQTSISWPDVHRAWNAIHTSSEYRKTWLKDSLPTIRKTEDEQGVDESTKADYDEVVERVKDDPELDPHEQKLLSCIVDAASMPTSFSQVHLPPHTIDSIRSIVSLPLLHPGAFQTGILKQHGMTGCLLFGPPGTGKTLVVRALAKEAGCRMMVISPSDVMDMYVGEGEKLVHAVFSLARKLAPCVIFLDEIDALFSARQSMRESGGAFAHRGIITEFMQEMDGLKTSRDDNVIVIGATNRPFDLDDAVLRRLPRRLLVDLPGVNERQEILKILLRDEVFGEDVDLAVLSKQTESFSGSDLKHLCVSAALDAVKEDVKLPWQVSSSENSTDTPEVMQVNIGSDVSQAPDEQQRSEGANAKSLDRPPHQRTLARRHFDKALKEITPSSSESLGSLAELRKWNEEFGEGRKNRKRRTIWGNGRFGFTDKDAFTEEGRVVPVVNAPSGGDTSSNV